MKFQPQITVAADALSIAETAAAVFVESIRNALNKQGQAAVALSGGSTPRQMHRLLAQPPHKTAIDWDRVHLFWVDERLVPYYDSTSNFGAACDDLIDPLALDPGNVHPVPVTGRPGALAADYQDALDRYFKRADHRIPVFDLICLGLGRDGHTASLFPDDPALNETQRWAIAVRGGQPAVDRITLSLPIINAARQVIFLVTGTAKSDVVYKVMAKPGLNLPAQKIRPVSGNLTWLLDRKAAGRIRAPKSEKR